MVSEWCKGGHDGSCMFGHAHCPGSLMTKQFEEDVAARCRCQEEDEGLKACAAGLESEWQWMQKGGDSKLQSV